MGALKRAMKWDEDTFGLEYDLNRFSIVAVSHFNFGAMENVGLITYNEKQVCFYGITNNVNKNYKKGVNRNVNKS